MYVLDNIEDAKTWPESWLYFSICFLKTLEALNEFNYKKIYILSNIKNIYFKLVKTKTSLPLVNKVPKLYDFFVEKVQLINISFLKMDIVNFITINSSTFYWNSYLVKKSMYNDRYF